MDLIRRLRASCADILRRANKKRAVTVTAALLLLISSAGLRGACPAMEKSAPHEEERFGPVHWYEVAKYTHSRIQP